MNMTNTMYIPFPQCSICQCEPECPVTINCTGHNNEGKNKSIKCKFSQKNPRILQISIISGDILAKFAVKRRFE